LQEFNQNYSVPKELKLQDLKSKWSDDGILTIEATLPLQLESKKPKIKEIPIEHAEENKDPMAINSKNDSINLHNNSSNLTNEPSHLKNEPSNLKNEPGNLLNKEKSEKPKISI
jgi:hypothetical protein